MKIAFIGTHGIPAKYGGAETSVQEISTRLYDKGHSVTVYGRKTEQSLKSDFYKGIRIKNYRGLKLKALDFPYRRMVSTINSCFSKYDILHFYGPDAGLYSIIPKILRKNIIVTCDGLEWERESYNPLVRLVLKRLLNLTMRTSSRVIVDSKYIQKWFKDTYSFHAEYIPYGAKIDTNCDFDLLKKYNLKYKDYFLFVGRLVEEKGIHILIKAFNEIKTEKKLVIIGTNFYEDTYEKFLRDISNDRVLFMGAIFGKDYEEIKKGAFSYITASFLEGSSPSLIQAMGFGLPVIVSDIPTNIEVIGNSGLFFQTGSYQALSEKMQYLLDNEKNARELGNDAMRRAKQNYCWKKISIQHEQLYNQLISSKE